MWSLQAYILWHLNIEPCIQCEHTSLSPALCKRKIYGGMCAAIHQLRHASFFYSSRGLSHIGDWKHVCYNLTQFKLNSCKTSVCQLSSVTPHGLFPTYVSWIDCLHLLSSSYIGRFKKQNWKNTREINPIRALHTDGAKLTARHITGPTKANRRSKSLTQFGVLNVGWSHQCNCYTFMLNISHTQMLAQPRLVGLQNGFFNKNDYPTPC